jgi:hypothetical protein
MGKPSRLGLACRAAGLPRLLARHGVNVAQDQIFALGIMNNVNVNLA